MRAADVLRLFASFEPSRAKLWEVARTYDPVDFARLVYLLGNVSRTPIVGSDGVRRPRTAATLPAYDMADPDAVYCCECTCANPTAYDPYGCGGSVRFVLPVEPWTPADVIRLGRAQYRDRRLWLQGPDRQRLPSRYPRFGATASNRCSRCNRPRPLSEFDPASSFPSSSSSSSSSSSDADAGVDDRLEAVLEAVMRHSSEPAAARATTLLLPSADSAADERRLAVALVQHNVATAAYGTLIDHVKHLLLPASYQPPRNTTSHMGTLRQRMIRGQVEVQYLRFYSAVRHGRWTFEAEPHAMSAVLLPPMGRFYDADHLTDLRDATRDVIADFPTDGLGDPATTPTTATTTATTTTTTTTNVLLAGNVVVVGTGGIGGPSSVTRDQTLGRYLVQPLYQGVRLVVYASPRDTRCYTRHGDLYPNLAYKNTRTAVPCVFEAVLLPVDGGGSVRSWRFWPYRADYALHVVDVFRYDTRLLVELPYADRVPFIAQVVAAGDSTARLRAIPAELTNAAGWCGGAVGPTAAQTWARIGEAYERHRDVFEPIAGVVLRDSRHRLVLPAASSTGTSPPTLGRPPVAYHFPVRFGYDLLEDRVLDLAAAESAGAIRAALATYQRLQVACDLADYRTVCAVYAHSDTRLHLCRYNRRLQQFVHAASIVRQPCDGLDPIRYRADFVYVLHAVTTPLGLFYLRVYYDRSGAVRGYDHKPSDSRYKVALAWDPLLLARAVAVPRLVEPFPMAYCEPPPPPPPSGNDGADCTQDIATD